MSSLWARGRGSSSYGMSVSSFLRLQSASNETAKRNSYSGVKFASVGLLFHKLVKHIENTYVSRPHLTE